jgi:hypothetical protein
MVKVRRDAYFLFFSTGFIIGGLTGILILNCLISYRIDQYHQRIQTLESTIEDKDLRLGKLEEAIHKKKLVVKNIEVILEYEEDEMTKITLQKHIKERLGKFIGKEVDKVDPDVLWEVIDRRIMKIKGKEYSLKVSKLVISETIYMTVKVQSLG